MTDTAPTSDTQDFGYAGPGVIGDLIWNDLNGDGIADPGEPGLPGVTVTITTTINGQPVSYTDVTDASGAYLVSGLPLGTYTLTVDSAGLPAGLTQTGDPDATNDNTSSVTLTAAAPSSDVQDFGYQGPGAIGDLIWNDLNGDGIQDPGEPGLPGVTVTVTTTINGAPVTYSAITGPTGAYLVDGLPLGDYTVTVDLATLPAGVTNTGDPNGGNDSTATVSLTAETPTSDVQDFGYQGLGAIGNFVWIDTNGDGIQDVGEPGIPGVTVTITTTINGSIVLYSATTDASGAYNVAGLPLGSFTVAVDPTTLPTGATPTFDADGTGTANASIVELTAAAPTSDAQDFGYRGPGHIGDLVWNDLNGDGIVDPGEPGLPGVTVTVSATVNGQPVTLTTTTGPDGTYTFDGLPLGAWTVTVDPATLPPGVLATGDPDGGNDHTATVTLTAAAPTSDAQDFGYQGPGAIGDLIWNDLNGDGIHDPGEPGLPGVTVSITTTIGGSPVTYTATTDADGTYLVDGLPLGDYTVTVDATTLPAGVLPTGDPDGGNDNTAAIALTAAAPTSDIQDFGYQGPGSIGDFVWTDVNGDGVQDAGEPGLPGVSVRVTTVVDGATVTYTTTTDVTGGYTITGLPLGDYTVAVIPASLPAGMVETFDADGIATADTSAVALTAAAPTSDAQDFGYQGPGAIGDLIWNDLNGNGTADPGEPGIPGVTVTATLSLGAASITVSTVTGSDGSYGFTGLPLGLWTVTVDAATLPVGVVQTGDPDAIDDNTSTVTLTAAAPTSEVEDFGYQGPGSIGDLIWNDLNGNGIADPGEPGLPGVTVTVTTTIDGSPVTYTAVTDATGTYLIDGLPLGDFTVTVDPATLPAGVLPTGDPDGGNDHTAAVTLTVAAPTSDVQDFGYQGPGAIGNFVWIDINGDGVQDAGEPGLAGVSVTITTIIAGSPVVYSATTDAAGAYNVAGLPLGSFTVTTDPATVPAGVIQTFDADGIATANTSVVALTAAAPTSDTQDFGYQGPGAIGDLIWNDLDGDGTVDPGEPGLPGVAVTITTTIAGAPVTLTTTTGPDGSYSFTGLPLGAWIVTVDPATLPGGMLPTGDPDGGNDNTATVTLTVATPTSDTQDFGYQGPGAIGNLIWNDLNRDGIADPGEPGIPGAGVTLTTTVGGTTLTYTTTTDANGAYNVDGLPLGDYAVTVDPTTLPAGVLPTGDPDGGNDNTAAVTLSAATPTSDTQDFGYQGPGSIGDRIWIDVDGNGVQDAGEPGIAGVAVTITTVVDGATLTYTATTDATGGYTVGGLPLGAFTVTVTDTTLPAGVEATFDADGTGTLNRSAVTLTVATPAVTNQDFGYQGPGAIGDVVWNDLNGDGILDAGEPGLPGVTVTITTTIGGTPVTLTTTTGPDGSYSFDGLPLGDWTVTVDPLSLPAGLTVTGDPDATKDGSSVVTLTAAAPTSEVQDFGYQGLGAIGNFVWTDLNSDGVQDPGEPGIAGVPVTIAAIDRRITRDLHGHHRRQRGVQRHRTPPRRLHRHHRPGRPAHRSRPDLRRRRHRHPQHLCGLADGGGTDQRHPGLRLRRTRLDR